MGRKVYDLFTFTKMTKHIINIEIGRSTLQGVMERFVTTRRAGCRKHSLIRTAAHQNWVG